MIGNDKKLAAMHFSAALQGFVSSFAFIRFKLLSENRSVKNSISIHYFHFKLEPSSSRTV